MNHYKRHLNFEFDKSSKEYHLWKCNEILGMIARMKDRNEDLQNTCIKAYGLNGQGKPKWDIDSYNQAKWNLQIIARLQSYFNATLKKVGQFSEPIKKQQLAT